MKILVTGGAGFIGSNFIYHMLREHPDYDIVCFDLLTYAGNLKTLDKAMKNEHFKFVKGDIADREFVDKLFKDEKFDIVVNFAAESHVDRSIENPEVFLRTNIMGTAALMDAARKTGVSAIIRCRPTRFTETFRSIEPICSSRRRRLYTLRARIPRQRLPQICLCLLITEPTDCL